MKLVTSTGDIRHYIADRSIASTLEAMIPTGFIHYDMSFYGVIYPGSPWITPGDGWKKEVEDALEKAQKLGFDFC